MSYKVCKERQCIQWTCFIVNYKLSIKQFYTLMWFPVTSQLHMLVTSESKVTLYILPDYNTGHIWMHVQWKRTRSQCNDPAVMVRDYTSGQPYTRSFICRNLVCLIWRCNRTFADISYEISTSNAVCQSNLLRPFICCIILLPLSQCGSFSYIH